MQRALKIVLMPTREQAEALLETLRQSTECFNAVCGYGWQNDEKNGVELHKATYYPLKAEYPKMPCQLLCAARVKATEALKSAFALRKKGGKVSCPKGERVPIRYDARSYRLLVGKGVASLASVNGRQEVAYRLHNHAAKAFAEATGFDSADLVYHKGKWHLHVVLTLPTPDFVDNGQAVGVDLGLNRPAVTSNRKFLGQRRWREISNRYFRLRRRMQRKGTKQAKRRLKRLSGKQFRFRADCDHVLSKQVVQSVSVGTTIVVENLTDIRTGTKQRGRQSRRRLHSWSFAQMRSFLTYKAEAKGCQVVGIDPRYTSQKCSRCAYIHRGNRKSQSVFLCRQCGYELNADLNGAKNIAEKYLASVGISDAGGPLSDGLLSQTPVSAERQDLSSASVSWPKNHTGGVSGAENGLGTSPSALARGI